MLIRQRKIMPPSSKLYRGEFVDDCSDPLRSVVDNHSDVFTFKCFDDIIHITCGCTLETGV